MSNLDVHDVVGADINFLERQLPDGLLAIQEYGEIIGDPRWHEIVAMITSEWLMDDEMKDV
jgi:hypothetical protein